MGLRGADSSSAQSQSNETTSPFYDPQAYYEDLNEAAINDQAPPPYQSPTHQADSQTNLADNPDLKFGRIGSSHGGMDTDCRVGRDGRLDISISEKTEGSNISKLLIPALRSQLKIYQKAHTAAQLPPTITQNLRLRIVIQVIGSRGDVQPSVALAKVLQAAPYYHRVRLATHAAFKQFVEENGIEFFCIGGDPSELMAYMVKNPGLMPGIESLRDGEVSKRRRGMSEMLMGSWRSCIEPGDGMGAAGDPFIADCIIANPPSFGHIHCAERLGVPLHLMFTMPWSPTTSFPHPLANIYSTNVEPGMTNFLSYLLVEMMTWQGLGDVVNKFRQRTLGLSPLSTIWAPGMIHRLRVNHTYCWSPALIPKPNDWGPHIDISGFYFLSLASTYRPPDDLDRFLNAGPPPVYIGFGSIVVDDPNKLTQTIFEAVRLSGVRAIVSKGWGGLGGAELDMPETIYLIDNCPHDWLFQHVSAVVHHGGAGTTAIGLAMGKPTVIVPFFGDQAFWGNMVHKRGLGPPPIHNKSLTAENLAEAIQYALQPEVSTKAQEIGKIIMAEDGAKHGAKDFTNKLSQTDFRCELDPTRVAVWYYKKGNLKISAVAAHLLVSGGHLEWKELRLHKHIRWQCDIGPTDPITGGASAILGTMTSVMMGVGDIPLQLFRGAQEVGGNAAHKSKAKENVRRKSIEKNRSSPSASSDELLNSESSPAGPGQQVSGPQVKREDSTVGYAELARGAQAIEQIVTAGVKSPRDFNLALAKGLHNAPLLYGDSTVRPHENITGIRSGLVAAGRGLGLGFYDGITGLVTQPIQGAREGGAKGFLKGFGKGLGGIVLKPGAGIFGLSGYAMDGIYAEVVKLRKNDIDSHIMSFHMADGLRQSEGVTDEERRGIVRTFITISTSKRSRQDHSPHSTLRRKDSAAASSQEQNDSPSYLSPESTTRRRLPPTVPNQTPPSTASSPVYTPHSMPNAPSSPKPSSTNPAYRTSTQNQVHNARRDTDFSNSINASVAETSRGNAEEDEMIARAMKASLQELQQGSADDAFNRAIKRSVEETQGYWDDEEVQRALAESLVDYADRGAATGSGGWSSSGGK